MKTMIIERGLPEVTFYEKTQKGDINLYVKSLREIGADYVELNYNSLLRLPKPRYSDRFIYRIEKRSDLVIANNLPFSYAVVPLQLMFLIPKVEKPIILEVNIGKTEPVALVSMLADNVDLTKISLLRLTGDFGQLPDEINELITHLRSRYAVPFDFCPLNNSLTALSTAISAYASRADSVTMSFGNNDNYASLEEFAITLVTMYKIILSNDFIMGICKAVVVSNLFTTMKTDNLKALMRQYGLTSRGISIIDGVMKLENISRNGADGSSNEKSFLEKTLSGFNLDKEINEQIIEILKDCSVGLCTDNGDGKKFLNQ